MFLCLDRRPNRETPWFGVTSDKTGSTYDLPVDKCGAVYMTCGERLSRCELLAYVDLAMTCRSTSNVELASSTLHTQVDSAARIDCRPIYLIWPLSLLRAYLQPTLSQLVQPTEWVTWRGGCSHSASYIFIFEVLRPCLCPSHSVSRVYNLTLMNCHWLAWTPTSRNTLLRFFLCILWDESIMWKNLSAKEG